MDSFIVDANISRFAGELVTEADSARRDQLKRLLIEEENKLGQRSERLEQVLKRLSECNARIANMETVLERSVSKGYDIGLVARVLCNLRDLHEVYEGYRQVIVDGLNRSPLL